MQLLPTLINHEGELAPTRDNTFAQTLQLQHHHRTPPARLPTLKGHQLQKKTYFQAKLGSGPTAKHNCWRQVRMPSIYSSLVSAVAAASLASTALGHGSLVIPATRNAIETLANASTYPSGDGACPCANGAIPGTSERGCANANACYWFSQGCSIGYAAFDDELVVSSTQIVEFVVTVQPCDGLSSTVNEYVVAHFSD